MKISHFRSKCIGCGVCVNFSPQTWKMNDADGLSDLLGAIEKKNCFIGEISIIFLEENKLAEENCPVKVIQVHN